MWLGHALEKTGNVWRLTRVILCCTALFYLEGIVSSDVRGSGCA
jgi:hypothetical protein